MRCYFLWDGHIAGIEMLPLALSDEDAIAKAHILSSKRIGPFGGFEVWQRGRCVFRHPNLYAERRERQRPLTDDKTRRDARWPEWRWPVAGSRR
jgi:hypothetical protein